MNKTTRKQIDSMSIELETIKRRVEEIAKIYDILKKELDYFQEEMESYHSDIENIENIANEERDKFDNLPERLQESELGETYEIAADTLEEAASNLEEAVSSLTDMLDDWADMSGLDDVKSGINACIVSLYEIE